ncbi:MAG: hypothetical protein ABWZ80_05935 [Beijerinckiaceae bacterium]
MSFRQIPFMVFAIALYFLLVAAAGVSLDRTVFTLPLPSGARMDMKVGELFILIAAVLSFIELINSTSASATAILNHGLSLGVFLICLLLFLLVPSAGTGTFLLMTLLTLIDTVAGYSISIMRARRDFTMERATE